MISYADFHRQPAQRRRAMELGIHQSLSIPARIRVYLDNGAFYFSIRGEEIPIKGYEEFVERAAPDCRPVPRDFIPIPNMFEFYQLSSKKQPDFAMLVGCLSQTIPRFI